MLHKYFFFIYKNWFVSLLLFKQIQFARGVLLVKVTWEATEWTCFKGIYFAPYREVVL